MTRAKSPLPHRGRGLGGERHNTANIALAQRLLAISPANSARNPPRPRSACGVCCVPIVSTNSSSAANIRAASTSSISFLWRRNFRSNSTAAARASCHVRLICGNVTPNRIRRAMGVPDTSARPRSSTGRSSEADAGGTGLTADQPLAACGPAAACGAPITSRMRFITSTTS